MTLINKIFGNFFIVAIIIVAFIMVMLFIPYYFVDHPKKWIVYTTSVVFSGILVFGAIFCYEKCHSGSAISFKGGRVSNEIQDMFGMNQRVEDLFR